MTVDSNFVGTPTKKKSKKWQHSNIPPEDPESIKLFNELTKDSKKADSIRIVSRVNTLYTSPFASVRSQAKNSDDSFIDLIPKTSTCGDFLNSCIERLEKGIPLRELEIKQLCIRAQDVLMNESNIVKVTSPVTVVGDIHGQFWDVIEMFKIGGPLPNTNYLFLGDYVDRGKHSVLTMSLLLCYKLKWPQRITLLRGNHETRGISRTYGFYKECIEYYGSPNTWKYFTDLFDYLTVAALIDEKIFCVHGGLSPAITSLDQIRVLDRFGEPGMEGPLVDLLWSDPDPDRDGFGSNHSRGAGYLFGGDIVKKFLHFNGAIHMCRAHQLCDAGYRLLFDDQLSTVWSAPNYCYRCGNKASVLEIDQELNMFFNIFEDAPEEARENCVDKNLHGSVMKMIKPRTGDFQAMTTINGSDEMTGFDISHYFL
ncbi:hypothetical protein C9374_006660 [Naegleria lovaniensis]|uniref:Serine/threonine-protein phosphatase n=1 Tax=Naegleria lovaniensis TaxID=51637 RepID=A0AA88KJ32_NAELO|nr:uncharacterized protein C9374_006660 [Naegleria lovaniensis]KAG2379543.1 hypothetical protein C9374_006660 [Naegleria lovaniensis]